MAFNNEKRLREKLKNHVSDSNTAYRILTDEAKRLEKMIKDNISKYYSSYEPEVYERTYKWVEGIYVTKPFKKSDGSYAVKIKFKDKSAYHPSYIDEHTQPMGYVPWLMEVGWDIRKKVRRDAYRFTHFEGTRYLEKAIKEFNRTTKYPIKVEVYLGQIKKDVPLKRSDF